jgi:hypothetical protein
MPRGQRVGPIRIESVQLGSLASRGWRALSASCLRRCCGSGRCACPRWRRTAAREPPVSRFSRQRCGPPPRDAGACHAGDRRARDRAACVGHLAISAINFAGHTGRKAGLGHGGLRGGYRCPAAPGYRGGRGTAQTDRPDGSGGDGPHRRYPCGRPREGRRSTGSAPGPSPN